MNRPALASDELADSAVMAFMFLDVGAYQVVPLVMAVFLLAASFAILRAGAGFGPWLGYLGILIGVAQLLAPLAVLDRDPENLFVALGYFGFVATLPWILFTCLSMLRAEQKDPTTGKTRRAPEPSD